MEWYWWAAIAAAVVVVIKLASGSGKSKASLRDDIFEPSEQNHQANPAVDKNIARIVDMVAGLEVWPHEIATWEHLFQNFTGSTAPLRRLLRARGLALWHAFAD